MTQTYLSNIQPYDIFFKEFDSEFGRSKHYYICIYTQREDNNNHLANDVYGLMITSNQKYQKIPNDYNVELFLNGKVVFVLCDKLFRFKVEETMEILPTKLTTYKKSEIKDKLQKFVKEIERQMAL
jgi:hypothetical protein